MSTLVVYASKYGTTRQYASWIAEELGADLADHRSVDAERVGQYDAVVYGGWLFAGSINGIKRFLKTSPKRLVVFVVGLSTPESRDTTEIETKNLPEGIRSSTRIFQLRGGIDYSKLNFLHRLVFSIRKRVLLRKPAEQRTTEERGFLDTFGETVSYLDKETIEPIVRQVRQLHP